MKLRYAALLVTLCAFFGEAFAVQGYWVERIVTFASPDATHGELESLLNSARTSVYVNVYTFTNPSVAELVGKARDRGLVVVVMLEGSPVGGLPEEEKAISAYLMEKGVAVCLHASKDVRFNHAKYIIVDNHSTMVMTENLGNTGFPKYNSYGARGWGVVIEDREFSEAVVKLFFSDLKDCEKPAWGGEAIPQGARKGAYRAKHSAMEYNGSFYVEFFTAPEEGVEPIVHLLESANESLLIEQAYIYEHWGGKRNDTPVTAPNLFLEEAIDAARRGAAVKILLDSRYNVEEDDPASNPRTVEYVNHIARDEALGLEAKLVDLEAAGLVQLHAKGVVVDGKAVLISSINWNEHSPKKNREIGVIIHGEPAAYYAEVFECDWEPDKCRPTSRKLWPFVLGFVIFAGFLYVLKKRSASKMQLQKMN